MSSGKERAAEILHGPEGVQIYLQLVSYVHTLARIRGWRAGSELPGRASPRSVAHEVVVKLLTPTGARTWDEGKEPCLLNALKGMARSEIGHLYQKLEASVVEPIGILLPDGEERTADSFPSTTVHPSALNPEEQLLQDERACLAHAAQTLLMRDVEGDPHLELVVLALAETDNPKEISGLTGLPIQRVYSARRQIERIVHRITPARVIRAARDESKS
jgi:hypothetical protein